LNRTDRLQAIITQLQSKKVVTAQEIADRFAISLRTVYRDIRALEEAGIPIGAEAGYGYFLDNEYHLPPVMFTNEEAGSILLAGKFIEQQGDKQVSTHFSDALYKIKSVLKTAGKDYLENLEERISVYQPTINDSGSNTLFIDKIQGALSSRKKLKMLYTSSYKKEETHRIVQPVGLVYYSLTWHLIAYCELREDYRDFRLDRITSIVVIDDKYDIDSLSTINEYFDNLILPEGAEEIKLLFTKESFAEIESRKYYFGYIKHEEKDDKILATFLNTDYKYIARWLVTLGNQVEILQPEELRSAVIDLVKEICTYYNH
jgi:predicted DNA-binding transcriptional regulator YafY